MMKTPMISGAGALVAVTLTTLPAAADDFYTSERVYTSRPKEDAAREFGHIGPTGIKAYLNQGVKVTIEGALGGSPAEGRFEPGEVIVAVNGKPLAGRHPFVALGQAITDAEAAEGKLSFEVESAKGRRIVPITIPALGAYAGGWPLDCAKARAVIDHAADRYHQALERGDFDRGIPGALPCLFLLSTGDDAHLPVIKKHYQPFIDNPEGIGDHTWNNGYNGIACAEYYLRTGDRDMLPVLQAFCDDARDRQKFDAAWPHWGQGINPGYVASGLMNPASTQVLTTLLLCKEAGVEVDDTTLLNCLKYFWRFAGRGTVPYGDHRGEGGLGSNGKDGMIAAAMQVACDAKGDTAIYQAARDYLAMSTISSYPNMVTGHGDNGRGDGIWRGLAASLVREKQPVQYQAMMDGIAWWLDLSRFPDGGMGMAMCEGFNDAGSGAAVALAYTAPRKTLRITGAPRSEHAVDFTLPAHLWGTEADLAFLDIHPHPDHAKHGEPQAMHQILNLLGSAYGQGTVHTDPDQVPLDQVRRALYHERYMVRAQAAKALRLLGKADELEPLLSHPDPRLRRAALDGLIDWNYWFAVGKQPLKPEQFTPGMIEAIGRIVRDPEESWYVVDGALFAIGEMPPAEIEKLREAILPWTRHQEWWLRESSFHALQGLSRDEKIYAQVVPLLTDMMTAEYHTMPRQRMSNALGRSLKQFGPGSEIGKMLAQGFGEAVEESEVKEGPRSREGSYNIYYSMLQALKMAPETAPTLVKMLEKRDLSALDNDQLIPLITGGGGFAGLIATLDQLDASGRKRLETTLYQDYRSELVRRLKATSGVDLPLIDALLALIQLKDPVGGWHDLGEPPPAQRLWHYTSLDPARDEERREPREKKRFRDVALPDPLDGWFKPDFDASGWQSGKAPIGKGRSPTGGHPFENQSVWGDGEILLARTEFELDRTDYDLYRLKILCHQGFHVYLNGEKISSYVWWRSPPRYDFRVLNDRQAKLLKKGTNTLAVYTVAEYPSAMKPHWKEDVFGQLDAYLQGLRKEDLFGE